MSLTSSFMSHLALHNFFIQSNHERFKNTEIKASGKSKVWCDYKSESAQQCVSSNQKNLGIIMLIYLAIHRVGFVFKCSFQYCGWFCLSNHQFVGRLQLEYLLFWFLTFITICKNIFKYLLTGITLITCWIVNSMKAGSKSALFLNL